MKKVILASALIALVLGLTGCGKCCTNSSTDYFTFMIVDSEGSDLLNPENEDYFIHDSISIYHFENGVSLKVHNPRQINAPYEIDSTGYYSMTVSLSAEYGVDGETTVFIEWEPGDDFDTIHATWEDRRRLAGISINGVDIEKICCTYAWVKDREQ